ncbi:sensor histidine kinase [Paenibacillus silviterrae]|uniref:sensor histidine kinase n=1 Tax=Paenibacillus silviterrae TaxID=3242194 RepID=UPI0025431F50|nr:HAMP domain-containing sensor histidine kinase [Paenibacillus chinjuensis]
MLYQDRIRSVQYDSLLEKAENIIKVYQSTPKNELFYLTETLSTLSNVKVQLFNKEGHPLFPERVWLNKITQKHVEDVIVNGGIIRDMDTGEIHPPMVGVTFELEGEVYALFLVMDINKIDAEVNKSIHVIYAIILLFGSIMILIAARYVVKPIIQLTIATKRMALGNFNIQLNINRKDEIGGLTNSFKEMVKQLVKLDRMRNDFVSSVSHEIQSPLTSISGFTKALKYKKLSEESRLHYLSIIESESERLSRLCQNLLCFSSLQYDQKLKVSIFRLDEQLRNVIINMEPQWVAKDIQIDIQLQPMTLQGDEDQLNQVWINLISNSIKFTPVKGRIVVRAHTKSNMAIVSVTDNGIGIPEDERTDIFKPFYKVDKARDSTVKGNGLGLTIVKKIIDMHNGEIIVTGSPGTGATFIVKLPN